MHNCTHASVGVIVVVFCAFTHVDEMQKHNKMDKIRDLVLSAFTVESNEILHILFKIKA
jgi:hypothetical protein